MAGRHRSRTLGQCGCPARSPKSKQAHRARDRRLLRPRRHPGRRIHRRPADSRHLPAPRNRDRRIPRCSAVSAESPAGPRRLRGPGAQGREHVAGSIAFRSGPNRRALVRAESSVPHLPGDAGAGMRAHGARAHGSAELVGADHSGPARGAFPGHQEHSEQPLRNRRRRSADRQGAQADPVGAPERQAPSKNSRPNTESTFPRASSTPTATKTPRVSLTFDAVVCGSGTTGLHTVVSTATLHGPSSRCRPTR